MVVVKCTMWCGMKNFPTCPPAPRAAGYSSFLEYHVAEAIETLSQTPGPFDLIFNDIDKECYPEVTADDP